MITRIGSGLFAVGAAVVIWMAAGFVQASPLAFAVTLLIGVVYVVGALELRRYHHESNALLLALGQPDDQADPEPWISRLPDSLRASVRQSLDTGRAALPAPALTPYLVGLLVMLGLIGTFVGLVSTLQGAVTAIETSTELESIRAGLTAPMEGLGMAFGTSVAGVAASAVLGLISTICRQHRNVVSMSLAEAMSGWMAPWTARYQQRQSEHTMQQVLEQQKQFQTQTGDAFAALAREVSEVMQRGALETGKQLTEAVVPLFDRSLSGFADAARATQQALGEQLEAQHERIATQLEQHAEAMLGRYADSAERHRTEAAEAEQQRVASLQHTLEGMLEQWHGASASVTELQRVLGQRLEALTAQLAQPVADIAQLSQQSATQVHSLTEKLDALSQAILTREAQMTEALDAREQAYSERVDKQEKRVERARLERDTQFNQQLTELVSSAGKTLQSVVSRFDEGMDARAHDLASLVDHISVASADLAALSEGFAHAVERFDQSGQQIRALIEHLDQGLQESTGRNEEQMGYYVTQAREIIDHNLVTQQEILAQWRALLKPPGQDALAGTENA